MHDQDFPAAHSMDTAWFAVDEAGRVAIFDSGEDGAVPLAALSLGGAGQADREAEQVCELLAGEDGWDQLHEAGPFYHYGNGDYGDPGLYLRTDHAPEQPANVAALPGPLRARMLRLPVDFTTAATLHLADFMADVEAATWGETTLRGEPLAPAATQRATASTSKVGWVVLLILVLAAAMLLGMLP